MKQNQIQSDFLRSRKAILLATGAILVLVSLAFLVNTWQTKKITFINDGNKINVNTKAETLGEFLAEQGIKPRSFDELNLATSTALTDGMEIRYIPGRQVTLNIAGQKKQVITTKRQVKDVLAEQNIALGPLDKVEPALNQAVQENGTVTVTRIVKKIVSNEKTVAFSTKKREDRTMLQGQQKVIQQGQEGKILERYEVVYVNGKPTSKTFVDSEVVRDWKDHIIAVGTARMVAASRSESRMDEAGKEFNARKTLRVRMTAYSPHASSTGKNPGDPGYAITASGATAKEGKTIAVDPNVVPLGWWVYIEGYGFRKAEDTGGAIKGNRMDLFFASEQEAQDFGVQYKTVHVIGPKKPN